MSRKQMQKLWQGAVAAGLAVAFVAVAAAKNNLQCTIVDEAGKPLAKQEFILSTTAGGKDKETKRKTDDAGVVEFKGLDDGTYQLRGEIPGYVSGKSAPISLSGNASQTCNYTIASAAAATALMQEVLQHVRQKQFAEAQEKGKKAIAWVPQEAGAHYVLAVAYASTGNEDGAVTELKKAAEITPEKYQSMVSTVHVMALTTQADEAMAKKDVDGAMKKYEAAIAVAPQEPTAYYNLAMAYARANKYEEAIKTIDKAIALKPEDAEVQQMKVRLQDMYLKTLDKKLEK